MNRFRSRKKSTGDGGDGSRRPSIDAEGVPSLPSFTSRTFKRKKQPVPEQKPEIDLSTALPATDDFRTSLLMPNLSARFSMLREQDDPLSKIGKANDDSVLFPKRASRLDLFNSRQQGLSDIAEDDSLRGSLRPPFAQTRTDSYASDGYGTDGEGGVMSRSRPGEGNTMFGGRQKIYKIPVGQAGSVKNFGSTDDEELPLGGNMGGKALYVSDTLPSAFQIMREQERQEREKAANDHFNLRSSNDHDRSGSPPLAKYNRNRETTSSTNSGPSQSRTSTAATSIASQRSIYGAHEVINGIGGHGPPPGSQPNSSSSDRPFQRAKKLYGQGLEQTQYDSQSSSLQRINSLNRSRGGGLARSLAPSKSASNLKEGSRGGYMPGGPLYSSNGFRAGSPPPSNTPPRMQEFDLGLDSNVSPISPGHADSGYGASPQMIPHVSPPMSPRLDTASPDATLQAALEPNDLGKATASGAFNKPKKQYDEQQYLQRQLQLQEGRNTPSPGPGSTARPFSPPGLILNEHAVGRSRNNSQTSGLSRSNSVMHPWEHQMEDRKARTLTERGRSPSTRRGSPEPTNPAMERSFFGFNGSDVGESGSESDPNSPAPLNSGFQGLRQPISLPETMVEPPPLKTVELQEPLSFNPEPGRLSRPSEEAASDSRSYRSGTTITPHHGTPHQSMPPLEDSSTTNVDPDSPTLGPTGVSNDLSGMVRQHLRNASGTSSVYPEDSPRRSRSSRPEVRESIFGHGSALDEQEWKDEISHDDHWVKRASQKRESEVIPPLPPTLHFAARQMLEQAQALKAQDSGKLRQMTGNDKAQRILGGEAPRTNHGNQETEPPWQEQLKSHHTRGPSTETQMEREGLANELEARKRAVRNNLQTFAEGQSRDGSPAPSAGTRTKESSPARPAAHPFSILKKTGKGPVERMPSKHETPTKAMKMLGIDANAALPTGSDGPPPDLFMGREQLPDRAMPPSPKNNKQWPQEDVRQYSEDPHSKSHRALFGSRSRKTPERPSPSSSKTGSAYSDSSDRHPRSRKGSKETAGLVPLERSLNADGSERNGAGLAGDESCNASILPPPPPPPGAPVGVPLRGSPRTGRSQSASRMRSRSNSKPTAPPAHLEPQQQRVAPPGTPVMINPSTGKRPTVNPHPYSANSAPSVHDHPSNHPTANHPITHPTMINPHPPPSPRTQQGFTAKFGSTSTSSGSNNNRNRTISKHDISEPTFVSCTSSVDTVSLPPGASLSNGIDPRPTEPSSPHSHAPPIPQRDSRRKRTQTLLAALSGRKSPPQETVSAVSSPTNMTFFSGAQPYAYPQHQQQQESEPQHPQEEEQRTFSADEDEPSAQEPTPETTHQRFAGFHHPLNRRLRKTSSEGGNMHHRANNAKLHALEEGNGANGVGNGARGEGGDGEGRGIAEHVPYQARGDVPASAVMF